MKLEVAKIDAWKSRLIWDKILIDRDFYDLEEVLNNLKSRKKFSNSKFEIINDCIVESSIKNGVELFSYRLVA